MNTPILLFFIFVFVISAFVQIFIIKGSARLAYGRKVSFGSAMIQWLLMILFQVLVWVIMMIVLFTFFIVS